MEQQLDDWPTVRTASYPSLRRHRDYVPIQYHEQSGFREYDPLDPWKEEFPRVRENKVRHLVDNDLNTGTNNNALRREMNIRAGDVSRREIDFRAEDAFRRESNVRVHDIRAGHSIGDVGAYIPTWVPRRRVITQPNRHKASNRANLDQEYN